MNLAAAFWLASYPKSGNTWVRMLLNAYHFGVLDINARNNYTQHDTNIYLYHVVSPLPLADLETEECLFLRNAVLMHLISAPKHFPNVIKTHNANITVGGVELIPGPMTAGAVYIVRDPRDVLTSFARHTGMSIDISIGHMVAEDNRLQNQGTVVSSWLSSWSGHVKSWDKPGAVRVKYEDMLEDTEREFTRILEGLGIKVDEEKVKKAVELCQLDRVKKQEEKDGFIEKGRCDKFFGQGKGWKEELTENQVRKIELDHGDMMKSLGYELEYP